MFSSPEEVLEFIKNEDVQFVDIRFCDLPGVMQHFNVPAKSVDIDFFTEGQAFDGSSIRGFQAIHESDMKLIPDIATAYLDPFRTEKTLIVNFSIVDPFTDEPYARDPRQIASKAEAYLKSTGSLYIAEQPHGDDLGDDAVDEQRDDAPPRRRHRPRPLFRQPQPLAGVPRGVLRAGRALQPRTDVLAIHHDDSLGERPPQALTGRSVRVTREKHRSHDRETAHH